VVLFVCHQFRIPATVGFILTGILAGPHFLALVKAIHEVEMLAESPDSTRLKKVPVIRKPALISPKEMV